MAVYSRNIRKVNKKVLVGLNLVVWYTIQCCQHKVMYIGSENFDCQTSKFNSMPNFRLHIVILSLPGGCCPGGSMEGGGEVNMGGWFPPPGALGSINGISFGSVSTMSSSGSGSVGVAGRLEWELAHVLYSHVTSVITRL